MVYNTRVTAGVMELVDVVDSKSTAGDSVPVRVRSPAPKILNAKAFGIFTFYLFTLHFSLKSHSEFLEVISNSEEVVVSASRMIYN